MAPGSFTGIGKLHPYGQIEAGATKVGPVFRTQLGLEYSPYPSVSFILGGEYSYLRFHHGNQSYGDQEDQSDQRPEEIQRAFDQGNLSIILVCRKSIPNLQVKRCTAIFVAFSSASLSLRAPISDSHLLRVSCTIVVSRSRNLILSLLRAN